MQQRLYDRSTPPHITTLVMVTAIGALSMNVFLPSLPGMARYFQTDYAVMQLAVSVYIGANAILQIFIGPASDRFGRRPVMLVCLGIFLVGTVGAIYAPGIELFLACRFLQAFSAAGMVLSRAIVRDTVDASQAASKIGYITMGMALVPMVAPMIGGYLDEIYDWRATFLLMLAFGVLTYLAILLDLGETNATPSTSLAAQFRTYPELFGSRRFWGYTATAGFTAGGFYAFLGGGPYVSSEILKLTPTQYGFYFGLLSVGYIIGNFSSGRFAQAVGINRMMLYGNLIAAAGMALSLWLFSAGFFHALSLFGPVILTGLGNGITLPSANAGIVSVRPHLAGSASGLGGALQIGGGALLAVTAGALLGPTTGPYPLIWVMLLSSLAAIVSTLYVIRVARMVGET